MANSPLISRGPLFAVVNECTLPLEILAALQGRQVYVVAVAPLLPGLRGIVAHVVRRLLRRTNVASAEDYLPGMARYACLLVGNRFVDIYPMHSAAILFVYGHERLTRQSD